MIRTSYLRRPPSDSIWSDCPGQTPGIICYFGMKNAEKVHMLKFPSSYFFFPALALSLCLRRTLFEPFARGLISFRFSRLSTETRGDHMKPLIASLLFFFVLAGISLANPPLKAPMTSLSRTPRLSTAQAIRGIKPMWESIAIKLFPSENSMRGWQSAWSTPAERSSHPVSLTCSVNPSMRSWSTTGR